MFFFTLAPCFEAIPGAASSKLERLIEIGGQVEHPSANKEVLPGEKHGKLKWMFVDHLQSWLNHGWLMLIDLAG
jgi:hypothetical protein